MTAWVWLGVVAVGGSGAVGRFVVDALITGRVGRRFPFGTMFINLGGAFALGLLTGLGVTGNLLLIAGTATLGSYTTFSTWMFETHRLAEDGEMTLAWANVILSVVLGFGVALLGKFVGAKLL
jgi:CrcB protein